MILRFRHAGLRHLFERGDGRRVSPQLMPKIERVLARLDEASEPGDMNLPGFRLHLLTGDLANIGPSVYRATGVSFSASKAVTLRMSIWSTITRNRRIAACR